MIVLCELLCFNISTFFILNSFLWKCGGAVSRKLAAQSIEVYINVSDSLRNHTVQTYLAWAFVCSQTSDNSLVVTQSTIATCVKHGSAKLVHMQSSILQCAQNRCPIRLHLLTVKNTGDIFIMSNSFLQLKRLVRHYVSFFFWQSN